MKVGDKTEINNFIHGFVPILFLKLWKVRKLLLIIVAHVKTAVKEDAFVADLNQDAAPSYILARAETIDEYF